MGTYSDQIEIGRSELERMAASMDGPAMAEALEISRATLYKICREYGIDVVKPKGGRPRRVVVREED